MEQTETSSLEHPDAAKDRHAWRRFAFVSAILLASVHEMQRFLAPVPQPPHFTDIPPVAVPKSPIPSKDAPLEEVMRLLNTPGKIASFYGSSHEHYEQDNNVLSYITHYRRSMGAFRENGWRGDCNDFSEGICETLSRHGYNMYIVTMRPRKLGHVFRKDWHQVAVCSVNGMYHIFSNNDVHRWSKSLEEYAEACNFEIIEIGGVIPWEKTRDNPLARFASHIQLNAEIRETQSRERFVKR